MKNYILLLFFLFPIYLLGQIDTEFWFAAPDITQGHANESRRDSTVYIVMTTFSQPSTVIISQPANFDFQPIEVTIPANSVRTVNLGHFLSMIETKPPNTIRNTGLLIRATKPITAYYEVRGNANTDIWALKGKNSLGTKFYVPFQNEYQNNQSLGGKFYQPPPRSGFVVMATKNNTQVSITPTKDILGHAGGETFTITLNRGETYYCESLDGTPENHFGGTLVESNKEITVTIKDDMVDVDPSNDGGADIIGDQLVAMEYLGTEHILIKGTLMQNADRGVICATQDNTEVYLDGEEEPVAILNAGEQHMFTPQYSATYIYTTHPVTVLQITGHNDQVAGAIIPALGCTGSNQVGFVRGSSSPFYLNLTIKAGSEGNFELNGDPNLIPASAFSPVPGTNGEYVFARISYSTAQVPVNQAMLVSNMGDELFHLGFTNVSGAAANFGYFSAFSYLNIGTTAEVCLNDSLVLDAGPGKTAYNWSTGENSQTITVYQPGTYTVEVLSGSNCYATDTIHVEYYNLPVDLGPNDTICENATTTLYIDGYYSFSWQDGSTENYFEVTQPGIYWVDVADYQGCALRDSIEIFTSPKPETPTIQGQTTYCQGETINLFMDDYGDVSYKFVLPSGEVVHTQNLTIENAEVNQGGNYYAVYTLEGCETDSAMVEVEIIPVVEVNLGEDISVCDGEEVVLNPQLTNVEFEWQDGSTLPTFTPTQTGTYHVTITDANNCSASDTIHVEFREIPINPLIIGETSYCEGDPISLATEPQENATFIWTFPGGSESESGPDLIFFQSSTSHTGTFSVQVVLNNCESEIDEVEVVVHQNPDIILANDTTTCNGTEIEISAPEGFETYHWSNDETTQNITVGAGIFEVTVLDANGCTGSATIEISAQGPVADFEVTPGLEGIPGDQFAFDDLSSPGEVDIVSWKWNFGDGQIDILQNTIYGFQEPGNYLVTLTVNDEMGCEDTKSENIIIKIFEEFMIPEAFSPNGDGINDVFEITGLQEIPNAKIHIFNRWGATVYENNNYGNGNFWDGKDCPDGTYFYILELPNAKPISGSVTIAR